MSPRTLDMFYAKFFCKSMNAKTSHVLLVMLFTVGVSLTFYKLDESPVTWMDEGLITQTSRNLATQGRYAIQTAPGEFASPGIISTSLPVTLPVALSYKIFGVGLLQARVVMALYIIAFFILAYLLVRKHAGQLAALLGLALLVTFAPIYGHGKNVLGEVPGLVWLLFALLTFKNPWSGIFFGLAMVTKPIFLLLLPAIAIVYVYKREWPSRIFIASLALPVLVWILVQFPHDAIGNILSIYANPHHTNLWLSIVANAHRFITEAQPFYALILLGIWLLSLLWRWRARVDIDKVELVAAVFSLFVYLAYLRTIGYYRYFFLGEVLELMYLPITLLRSNLERFPKVRPLIPACLILLVAIQFYQTSYHSWVASAYGSHRTRDLSAVLSQLPPGKLVFVYQAPELANFLPSNNYLQYVKVAEDIIIGADNLPRAERGEPELVLAHAEDAALPIFSRYEIHTAFDQYMLMTKRWSIQSQ